MHKLLGGLSSVQENLLISYLVSLGVSLRKRSIGISSIILTVVCLVFASACSVSIDRESHGSSSSAASSETRTEDKEQWFDSLERESGFTWVEADEYQPKQVQFTTSKDGTFGNTCTESTGKISIAGQAAQHPVADNGDVVKEFLEGYVVVLRVVIDSGCFLMHADSYIKADTKPGESKHGESVGLISGNVRDQLAMQIFAGQSKDIFLRVPVRSGKLSRIVFSTEYGGVDLDEADAWWDLRG